MIPWEVVQALQAVEAATGQVIVASLPGGARKAWYDKFGPVGLAFSFRHAWPVGSEFGMSWPGKVCEIRLNGEIPPLNVSPDSALAYVALHEAGHCLLGPDEGRADAFAVWSLQILHIKVDFNGLVDMREGEADCHYTVPALLETLQAHPTTFGDAVEAAENIRSTCGG
jgi:hypothetical protein